MDESGVGRDGMLLLRKPGYQERSTRWCAENLWFKGRLAGSLPCFQRVGVWPLRCGSP